MPTPTIDFKEVADGVTAILNARAHEAQLAQRDAERLANEQAQRESDAARAHQIANIRAEFARLCTLQVSLTAEIETKSETQPALSRELPILGAQLSALLAQLGRMREQHPFLKG